MRRFLRQLRRTFAGLLLLVLMVIGATAVLVWLTMPGGDAVADIPGLAAAVEITVDADGMPRIRAGSADDAAAALGWLHARERMFQMELMRRAAAGDLAELVGKLALSNDRMMRVLGVRAHAEADLAGLPAETRATLEAYARGVNAYIAARGRFAGMEFLPLGAPRPWMPVDSLLWAKTMGLYLSGNWRTELARAALVRRLPPDVVNGLFPASTGGAGHPEAANGLADTAARLVAALPRFPDPFTLPESASDEWAVDGAHSATGAPLLAGDPHLGFGMPGIWYLARIELPGRALVGATAPGVPFIVLGHNGHIAWTFTTTGADVQDLFIETPTGSDSYLTPDGPRHFATRTETIHVRGAADEVLTVRETRHGPVISDLVAPNGPILAVEMANLAPGDTAAAGLQALNTAETVAEASRAAPLITSPVQNMLVADRDGIGLFVIGRVPIRRSGDGALPAPGADGSHDWIGWAAGEQLPHYVSPPSGRLVNGNERIAPADFPVFLGRDWPADWRARRIRELLAATARHSVDGFTAMQADVVSPFARDILPRLGRVQATDERSRNALALLALWDGSMSADKPQPLIFNAWMANFHTALLDRLDAANTAASAGLELVADTLAADTSPHCGGGCDALLARTLAAALADLVARYGERMTAWSWGEAHPAVFAHPLLRMIPGLGTLASRDIASPGDDTTLLRASPVASAADPALFTAVHGASFRAVYDLADLERSRFLVAPGQSGHIFSVNAWNFVRRWRDGGTITLAHTPASVAARIRLLPEGQK